MRSATPREAATGLPSNPPVEPKALREAVDLNATLSLAKSVIANHPWPKPTVREFNSVIRQIEERAADKQLYLAILGEFSVGKSSFINALLRENLLLSDVLQGTTAAPTIIRLERLNWWDRMLNFFGVIPPRTITIRFKDGTEKSRRYRNAGAFKAAIHGSANAESLAAKIEKIIVGHTADSLVDGLVIIDTPGLNSDNGRHSEVVESVVNELADGFVILTSAEPPLPNSLLDFLHRHLADSVARSALVVTKMDLIPSAQRARHLAYIQTRFRREFSLDNSLVLAASPKFLLDAKASPDAAEWTKSFHEAELLLKNFLRVQRTAILAERTAKLLSRMLAALHSELSALDGHFRGRQIALEQSRPSDEQAFFTLKRADYLHHFATQVSRVFADSEEWLEGLNKSVRESVLSAARTCSGFSAMHSELIHNCPGKVDQKVKAEVTAHLQLIDRTLNRLARELEAKVRAEYFAAYPKVFNGTLPAQTAPLSGAKLPLIDVPMSAHLSHIERALETASSSCLGIGFLVDIFKDSQHVNATVYAAAEATIDALFRNLGSNLRDAVKTIAEQYSQMFDQCMLRISSEYGARVKAVATKVDQELWEVTRSRQQIQADLVRVGSRETTIEDARRRFSEKA
jgi:GTP-binding protein EngB required for normal cell division